MDDDLHRCRVCGLHHGEDLPWGERGIDPTFWICDCCGTEFGYQDCLLRGVHAARERWLAAGGEWRDKRSKPENWNRDEQLRAIPERWR